MSNPSQLPLSRRKFLISMLASAGLLAGTKIGKARTQALEDVSIIVIGAGCAGLGAAHTLRQQGAKVTVLEARDRIGGRLYTDWSMGPPFEVGAGWIHGPSHQNPSKQLCDAVQSQYFLTDDYSATTFDPDGTEWSEERLNATSKQWSQILEELEESLDADDRRTMRQAIEDMDADILKNKDLLWALSAYSEFSAGASIERFTATGLMQQDVFPYPDVVVLSGYDKMLEPLAQGLDIRKNHQVQSITYDQDMVTVQTTQGTFQANYCICSVPLGVLKSDQLTFHPPLPDSYTATIENAGFKSVTKLALKFDQAFWDPDTQYFGIATEEKGRWNYWVNYRTFSKENILLGVSVGDYAPIADAMDEPAMLADAMQVLRGVWGDDVSDPIQVLSTHWTTDPYSLGAYTHVTPDIAHEDLDALAEPVADQLLFCGEHTIFSYVATTHGAYLSGLRAAEAVIDLAG